MATTGCCHSDTEDDDHRGHDHEAYVMEEWEVDDVQAMMEEQMDTGRAGAPDGAERIDPVGKSDMDLRMDRLPTRSEPFEPPRGMLSVSTGRHNTGPKGVIADYEDAKRGLRIQRMFERITLERAVQRQVQSAVDVSGMTGAPDLRSKQKQQQGQRRRGGSDDGDDSDDDSDDDEDEDAEDAAAFEAYKQQRAQALQATLPVFGTYGRCESRRQFADLVKSVHENCFVVAHVYDNSTEACVRLHFSFEALCTQFTHVRFVRLRSTDAFTNFAQAGLPALLIYRGGQMISSALRITDALPAKFTDLDVARLLQSKKILTLPTGYEQLEARRQARHTHATGASTSDAFGDHCEGERGSAGSVRRSQVASLSDSDDSDEDEEVDDL